jgi:hypothetical protein
MMKNKMLIIFFCFVIPFLAFTQLSFAKTELLGYISDLSGDIQIRRVKETVWTAATLNEPVYFGDNIKTGPTGEGTVTFTDQSLIKIRPNSHITLNAFVSPFEKKNSVLLFFGRIWNKLSRKALKLGSLEVQTPTAVCGVRGTEFWTASYEDGTTIIRVESGEVTVDNEIDQRTISSDESTQLSFAKKEIEVTPGFEPQWERAQKSSRQNLFSDGEKYGGFVHGEIYKRRDHLKLLVEKTKTLSEERERYVVMAKEAEERGDDIESQSYMSKAKKIQKEIEELNRTIAFHGRRLECQFGLFSRYAYLAKHPEFSKRFTGKEFILKELDNIEMIHAEFNALIEEGMKMSMEDMEDLITEMKGKVREYKEKEGVKDPFDELD